MKRTSIFLSDGDREVLAGLMPRYGTEMAEVIRLAIRFLAKHGPLKEETVNYSDILKNKHFQNFQILMRIARREQGKLHIPYNSLVHDLQLVAGPTANESQKLDRALVAERFSKLITTIASASDDLHYSTDDYQWFVSLVNDASDGEIRSVVMLLIAYSAAPES